MREFVGGAVAVALLIGWELLNHWSVLEPTLQRLRQGGATGNFLANIIMSPLLPIALGTVAVVLLYRGYREFKQKGVQSGANPAAVHNETNPHIEFKPHIEVNPQIVGATASIALPQQTFETEREEIAALEFIHAERRDAEAGQILVAIFKNVPKKVGEKTPSAGAVTAHLTFRNPENPDEQELHIDFGTWVSEYTHFATFSPGKTHALIVTAEKADGRILALDNPNSTNPRNFRFRSGISVRGPEECELPWLSGEVEIVLVNHGVTIFQGRFRYELERQGEMTLKPTDF